MGRRLTQTDFLERAVAKHGARYDYSKTVYTTGGDKVCIVCPDHGEFWQRANSHLEGQICPECAKLQRKQTCQSRYGTAVPMISDGAREKARRTCLARYGGPNPMSSSVIRERIRATFLSKYGVDNPQKVPEVRARTRATNLVRYGYASSFQNPDVRMKQRATLLAIYGVSNSMQVDEVRAKAVATWRSKYGVDNPMRADVVREKAKHTCLRKYGVAYPVESPLVQAKARQTCVSRYGVDNVWKLPAVRMAIKQTCQEKYGFDNPMQNEAVAQKGFLTRARNHTFNTSCPEETLYGLLVAYFGEGDVFRQYKRDDRYPYMCDFYVQSRDMFVELNASWTHGGYWFEADVLDDVNILNRWRQLLLTRPYYRSALETWSVRDVKKRQIARENHLNYVVFWDNQLRDAKIWFGLGCPDGTDWDRPWSWCPDN